MKTFLAALILIVCGPHLAEGRECVSWGERAVQNIYWPYDYRTQTYCRRYRHDYEGSRVYGYERRERERDREEQATARVQCLFEHPVVRATGDDKLDVEKARISAQDRWAIEVETLRGTRFSDIHNAERMTAACIEKVPTTDTEKGQASILGLRHYVCQVEAIPCTAPKLPIDPDEIAKRRAEQIGRKADPRADYYEPEKPKKRFLERWRRTRQ